MQGDAVGLQHVDGWGARLIDSPIDSPIDLQASAKFDL